MKTASGLAGLVIALALAPVAAAQIVFGPQIESISMPYHLWRGACADLDADGHADLAYTDGQKYEVRLFFGDGRGHFGPAMATTPAISSSTIGFGDMDGDGHVELLTAPYTPGHLELDVWTGLGGAQFSGPTSYALAGSLPNFSGTFIITAADADGDADLDVTVVVAGVGPQSAATLLINDGAGGLTPFVIMNGDPFGHIKILRADVADLNADGLPDAVCTSADGTLFFPPMASVHLLLGQPGGTFVESKAWQGAFQLGLVDLSQDGLLDVVTTSAFPVASGKVTTRLGLGGAQFADQPAMELPQGAEPTALADFDGDAVPDLLVSHVTYVFYPTWAVLPGDGHGGFDAAKIAYSHHEEEYSHEFQFAVDTTDDGRVDVVDDGIPPHTGPERQVRTSPNWTYPPGSAQLDLGQPQFGGDGWPGTLVSGSFVPDEAVTVKLWEAGNNLPAVLVAGLTESFAPFKGGVMVPEPDALLGPISTGTNVIFELHGRWPGGLPVGTTLTLQWWIADPTAPQGMSASTAVRITQP